MFISIYFILLLFLIYLLLDLISINSSSLYKRKYLSEYMNVTGYEIIKFMLKDKNISNVYIEKLFKIKGQSKRLYNHISAHYDLESKTIRLKEQYYNGNRLIDVAIAAHEVGHAIQHEKTNCFIILNNINKFMIHIAKAFRILFFIQIVIFIINYFIFPINNIHIMFTFSKINNFILLVMIIVQLMYQGYILLIEVDASQKAYHYLTKAHIINHTHKKAIENLYKINTINVIRNACLFYI